MENMAEEMPPPRQRRRQVLIGQVHIRVVQPLLCQLGRLYLWGGGVELHWIHHWTVNCPTNSEGFRHIIG